MKFEEYMRQTLEKMVKGEPFDRSLWDVNMAVFTDLIKRGVDPKKARRAMEILMVRN